MPSPLTDETRNSVSGVLRHQPFDIFGDDVDFQVDQVTDASLSYSSLGGWDAADRGDGFLGLAREVWRTRAYGDFWSYMLVAEGAVDVAAEPDVALHDLAAPSIVVTEAGGRFTDLDGTAGPAGGSALATNGLLHDDVLARLAP